MSKFRTLIIEVADVCFGAYKIKNKKVLFYIGAFIFLFCIINWAVVFPISLFDESCDFIYGMLLGISAVWTFFILIGLGIFLKRKYYLNK